jgi:iron complex transport system ATP-binding protein
MAGLLTPDNGTIHICERDMKEMSKREIAFLIGYVPQTHTPAFDYQVEDFVLMGRAPKVGMLAKPTREDEEQAMKALESLGIAHLAHRSYLEISGGERQQVLIARTLAQEPKAILFDEPTAHLDYGNQHRVLQLIRKMAKAGYAIIMTTHNPDHALLLGDQAAIVEPTGSITCGPCEEIITEEKLCRIYGADVRLLYIEELERRACFAQL